ncbi:hypothetical protein EOPP23_14745 [Endozoicomonas sp. OPT23]|nr:hypothetical protein [Endozoicomonas sp. OPT23]
MFDDKEGGNVTTLHNFENGVTATAEDQARYEQYNDVKNNGNYDRKEYDRDFRQTRKDILQSDDPVISAYTGNELPKDGRMHLDHVVAAKTIETAAESHLYMNQEERIQMANQDANLKPCESNVNQSLQDKEKMEWANAQRKADPGKTNAESFGVDLELMEKTNNDAKEAIKSDQLKAQIQKQGTELLQTGASEAGKNALRQAMGVLLHEFVSGVFNEITVIFKNRSIDNIVEHVLQAAKRVAVRVKNKMKTALEAAFSGGIQGFISNLLTFMINTVVKTSAKVVTIIRESISGIYKAVKLVINPPEGTPRIEVARQATKILAGVITTGFGLFFEEAIKGFILTVPVLAPLGDIFATGVTAVLTGISAAVMMYGLDRFFDWLSSSGTEFLQAIESNLDATKNNIQSMANWIQSQYQNSVQYQAIGEGYLLIEADLQDTARSYRQMSHSLSRTLGERTHTLNQLSAGYESTRDRGIELDALLDSYQLENQDVK